MDQISLQISCEIINLISIFYYILYLFSSLEADTHYKYPTLDPFTPLLFVSWGYIEREPKGRGALDRSVERATATSRRANLTLLGFQITGIEQSSSLLFLFLSFSLFKHLRESFFFFAPEKNRFCSPPRRTRAPPISWRPPPPGSGYRIETAEGFGAGNEILVCGAFWSVLGTASPPLRIFRATRPVALLVGTRSLLRKRGVFSSPILAFES